MGSGGGGGGGNGNQTNTIRYAPYIENHHKVLLDQYSYWRGAKINDSPFDDYVAFDIDAAFFGLGYTLASFPTLYDMYGKFMAGLDVDALWEQTLASTVSSTTIDDLVATEADLQNDIIEANIIPAFNVGMRDINAVMSSSFVIGQALIRDDQVKNNNKFSNELRYKLIPVAHQKWQDHLAWNKGVVTTYSELTKLYLLGKIDIDNHNFEIANKRILWPFTVLDYERIALGTLQGAQDTTGEIKGASKGVKVLGGALGGAAVGASFGPMGAATGAVVGGIAGAFM